jgi:twitching motility protein PilT
MARIDGFLKAAVDMRASDLHIAVGSPPLVRQFGQLKRFKYQAVTPEMSRAMLHEIISPAQRAELEKNWELDFAYEIPGLARFRSNAFFQR